MKPGRPLQQADRPGLKRQPQADQPGVDLSSRAAICHPGPPFVIPGRHLSSRTRSGIQCHTETGLRIRSAMTCKLSSRARSGVRNDMQVVIPGSTRGPQ